MADANHPAVRKFLDFLGKAEGADYNTIVGGSKFSDYSTHPNVVGAVTSEGKSTAAGKYQITGSTYREMAPKLGVTGFTPEDQDKIALGLIQSKGALKDVEAGDYNTAISKLGGIWASLPSSRYKQPKRSQEWVDKELGSQPTVIKSGGGSGQENPQFSTVQTNTANIGGLTPSNMAEQAARRSAEHDGALNTATDFRDAVVAGFEMDNSVVNWYKTRALKSSDANFSWLDEDSKKALDTIPTRHWDYVLQALSAPERDARLARVKEHLGMEQKLSEMGGVTAFAGRFAGGMSDPVMIASTVFSPEVALLSRTSRISNAIRLGAINGAMNTAYGAATASNRPLATSDDVYADAMMGFAMGAGFGFGMNPKKLPSRFTSEYNAMQQAGTREHAKVQIQALEGHELTPEGQAYRQHLSAISENGWQKNIEGETKALIQNIRNEAEEIRKQYLENPKGRELYVPVNAPKSEPVPKAISAGEQIAKIETKEPTPQMKRWSQVVNEIPTTRSGNERPIQSVHEALTKITQSADPVHALLAKRLKEQLPEDVRMFTIPESEMPKGALAYYKTGDHSIYVTKTTTDATMLHEVAHALTVHKLDFGERNLNTAHGKLYTELNSLFEEARAAAKGTFFEKHHYMKNLYEFAAGVYNGSTAHTFHAFLKTVKAADDVAPNLLTRFVMKLRDLLGLEGQESNLFLRSMNVLDKLGDERLDVHLKNPYTNAEREIHLDARYDPADAVKGIDPETAQAATAAGIPKVFGRSLGLEHSLGRSGNDKIRDLAAKLFGTTVGYENHAVVKGHAYEDTIKLAEGWIVSLRKETDTAFRKYSEELGVKKWQQGETYEKFGTEVSNYIRGMEGDYHPQVIKAGDAVRRKLAEVTDHINNPLHSVGGKKRGLTEMEVVDPETGAKSIVGTLEKNENYLPRKHDITKWQNAVMTYGMDTVHEWWAQAFKNGREGISDEVANKWAKWYVRTVNEAHADRKHDLLEELMRGTDREALKLSLMENGGFDESGALKVIDSMLPTKESDAGRTMASLKHRNTIDEKFVMKVMKDGETHEISLNNFIHANAFDVVEPYLRRTASSVALAKHLDVYKIGDIDKLIHEATTNSLGESFRKAADVERDRKNLKFAFERIQGLPMEEFSWWSKSLQMWRDFNVIRLMGGTVWNQATESAQIVGSMGWKATLDAIPELKALKRDIETGKAPNEILDHLENTIGGAGSEYVARMEFKPSDDWVRHSGDTKYNRWLDRVDNGVKRMARGTLDYTGMTPVMIQQKRVHAVALVNHFVEAAHGKASGFLTKDRLAWMGMDEADAAKVYTAIQKYTAPKKGEFGKGFSFDIKGFANDAPKEHAQLMTAIHRETRRVIQENDLASMIPLMGHTLAKTVFQFQNFTFHGWNKSLMFAANHKDWSTFSSVMHGSLFAGLAYMGRTMVDSMGMSDDKRQSFLEKRMSTKQIVANSFGRTPQMSMLPQFYDTLSPFPMFNGMRTTSDVSSLASNPTMGAINSLMSMKKMISNGLDPEKQTTDKDIRTWAKLAPWSNVAPISTLINAVADDYPHHEKQTSN